MDSFIAFMVLMYVSLRLGDWDHKTSIGATIEYNILSNQAIKEEDIHAMLQYKSGSLVLDEKSKSKNQLWFTFRNGFWYPPGRVVYNKNESKLYLYTPGHEGLYPKFFSDAILIASYFDTRGIPYCTSRTSFKGIWTAEMEESDEVKIIDSKKCK